MIPLWARIVGGLALAAALIFAFSRWTNSIEQSGYERAMAVCKAERDRDDLARTRASLRQSEVHREEEARREAEKVKVTRDLVQDLRRAREDAAAADRAAGGLRDQLAAFIATARYVVNVSASSAPASGSPAADPDLDLLADLLRESEDRAGSLAAALDASRAAGIAAERSYDALTPSSNK